MIAAAAASLPNRRVARCARCHSRLAPRQGIPYQGAYLCTTCAGTAAAEEQALAAASWALGVIGIELDWGRPLGFVDEQRVRSAIRRHLARGARNATQAAIRIQRGEHFTVWQIVDLIAKGQDFVN